MKGATRAGMPPTTGRAKRRGRVAPAELARLLKHPGPLLASGWSAKQIKDEAKRLERLKARLYGRVVFPLPEPGAIKPPPAGGHRGGDCCSHRWADDAWRHGQAYPPAPEYRPVQPDNRIRLGLRRCPGPCAALMPAVYFDSSGVCWDCHHQADEGRSIGSQRSASVIGPRELRER